MKRPRGKTAALAAAAAGLAAAIAATAWWALSPGTARQTAAPAPVSDIDTLRRACLLTDGSSDAATTERAWSGMRQAAAAQGSALLVQRFALPAGVQAGTYVNTLAAMRCGTIITVGDDLSAAGAPIGTHRIVITDLPVTSARTTELTPAQVTPAALAAALGAVRG